MKALALKQPFASLIACGSKTIETRPWNTNIRGDVLICSTKGSYLEYEARNLIPEDLWPVFWPDWYGDLQFSKPGLHGRYSRIAMEDLPRSMGLAVVRFDKVSMIDPSQITVLKFRKIVLSSCLKGTYCEGKFGIHISNIRVLKQPVPVTCRQRFFDVEIDLKPDNYVCASS